MVQEVNSPTPGLASAAASAGASAGNTRSTATPGSAENITAPLMMGLMTFGTAGGIPPEGEKYLQNIENMLTATGGDFRIPNLSRHQVSNNTFAFVSGNDAFLIMFVDTISQSSITQPASYALRRVTESSQQGLNIGQLRTKLGRPDLTIVGSQMIQSHDFEYAPAMARDIASAFAASVFPQFSKATFRKMFTQGGSSFVISRNINAVRQLVRSLWPTKVMPPISTGFVLYLRPQNNNRATRIEDEDLQPVGVVGLYTDFQWGHDSRAGHELARPFVHISCLKSIVPNFGAELALLALTAEQMVDRDGPMGFIDQFDNYSPTGGDGENIGQLKMLEDGKLWFADSVDARRDFCRKWLNTPALCIDVVEGTYNPQFAYNMIFPTGLDRVQNAVRALFELRDPVSFEGGLDGGTPAIVDTVGTYGETNGVLEDSRNQRYLRMVRRGHVPEDVKRMMLYQYSLPDPEARARYFSQALPNYRCLYAMHTRFINARMLSKIMEYIKLTGIQIASDASASMNGQFSGFSGLDNIAFSGGTGTISSGRRDGAGGGTIFGNAGNFGGGNW